MGDALYGDAPPMITSEEDLESYKKKKHTMVVVKTLTNPVPRPNESIGKSEYFTASPSIVHFDGLVVGKLHEQVVSIINTSKVSQRLSIFPTSDPHFKLEYDKSGSLAPGMSQKITIKFRPEEYKYYHDFIRIQTDGQLYLLIPLHAYPVLNKIDFPANISFGNQPLCEPSTQMVTLKCSIPVDFSFEIEVVRPHPYYRIEPLNGVIPANGSVDIRFTFIPITLGSCSMTVRLHVGQYGFVPMECGVSASAVSGLIESRELKEAELRLMEYIKSTGEVVNNFLGKNSTFRGDLSFLPNPVTTLRPGESGPLTMTKTAASSREASTMLLKASGAKNHFKDPTATLMASTFQATDLNTALDAVLNNPRHLGTKVPAKGENVFPGVRAIDGTLEKVLPVHPRGPGSGVVFDAGAQWMSLTEQKKHLKMSKSSFGHGTGTGIMPPKAEDRIIEGLRVPPTLDSYFNVNFVLTQEPGKLKPKDLKVAIERSRAEREQRAEEQKKIREEGGGAGLLDLRGILAEERLNLVEGDPFKRQLREMAFLADVDDVDKQEKEKEFRISEEFIGSSLLTDDDVQLVYRQRSAAMRHKKRVEWRTSLARQHTALYTPLNPHVKAGAPAEVAKMAAKTLTPSYDANRNDVWAKRMNTLRRLISLVSRYLVRERISTKIKKLMLRFAENGVTNKEEAKEFIARENAEAKAAGPVSSGPRGAGSTATSSSSVANDGAEGEQMWTSVAEMVCDAPNEALAKRTNNELVIATQRYEFTANMCRRVLFPKFVAEEAAGRAEMPPVSFNVTPSFDDQTFFQLKLRPEYVSMGYTLEKVPPLPLTFAADKSKALRQGAAEERALRPAADAALAIVDLLKSLPPEPPTISQMRSAMQGGEVNTGGDEATIASPAWLTNEPTWSQDELNFFKSRPELRTYVPAPVRCETDADWILRPHSEQLVYDEDASLRSSWLHLPGFRAVNTYLLTGQETRNTDPAPNPGPTLIDFYMPDSDRHSSGLQCFANDHTRSYAEEDADVGPLQTKQDKNDQLTDSESDDEETYLVAKPSIELARSIIRTVDTTAPDSPSSKANRLNSSLESTDFAKLDPSQRIEEQVELMRDRKTLDLESSLLRLRQEQADTIAKRLAKISSSSKCVLQALPTQKPFSMYEEQLLKEEAIAASFPILSSFVEDGGGASSFNSPTRNNHSSLALSHTFED